MRKLIMRHLCFALIVSGVMLLHWSAIAGQKSIDEPDAAPGQKFIQERPHDFKDYYVMRKANTDQCSVVAKVATVSKTVSNGVTGSDDKSASGDMVKVGDAPYASRKYAEAALKKFPECKGTIADEGKPRKNK